MIYVQTLRSDYSADRVGKGIVHIGLGAFHRAHQAVYLEKHLNRHGGGEWGICAANIRSNHALVDSLNEAGCRYWVAEYQDSAHVRLREVNAIREALYAGADKSWLLGRMAAPETRIVMLTVTEKGYCLVPAESKLRMDDPGIRHDIEQPLAPVTAPGLLVEALRLRRERMIPPFTVLSCDNMPDNGHRTRQAVTELAACQSEDLAEWIRAQVAFPSSMVDRIVPAMSEDSHRRLRDELECADPNAVMCEAFSQWVVEDNFPLGRPDWEADGVQMVADVRPFETMKLRMLNGSHSLLAYLGVLAGWTTVAEAMADPAMRSLLRHYLWEEAAPSLRMPDGVDVSAYAEDLLKRFANDSLQHRLTQIAMDGSQKLPQRWLQGTRERLRQGGDVSAVALGVAAWIHYVGGRDLQGRPHPVDDPLAETCRKLHDLDSTPQALLNAFFDLRDVFPADLAAHSGFYQAVLKAYRRLARHGVKACLELLDGYTANTGA